MDGRIEMNRNGHITTVDAGPSNLVTRESPHELIVGGGERIQDLVRQSTLEIQQVLAEVRETIAKTEAELEVNEKISIVLERDRTVMSLERNFRLAKDK